LRANGIANVLTIFSQANTLNPLKTRVAKTEYFHSSLGSRRSRKCVKEGEAAAKDLRFDEENVHHP
jgi:hypothetical protein